MRKAWKNVNYTVWEWNSHRIFALMQTKEKLETNRAILSVIIQCKGNKS